MEIRNLKTFQVVAEKLNLTEAAKELKYTQPTVTLHIQALEERLNHKLLTRIGKETFLTAAGKRFKVHADHLLAYIEDIERDMQKLHRPDGTLTIAASEYYCTRYLALIIKAYSEMYPNVRLNLLPLNSHHALTCARNHVADIAIVAGNDGGADLNKNILDEEHVVLVASSEISQGKNVEEIFSDYPFISYDDDCSFSEIASDYFKETGLKPESTIICGGSDETIKRIVLNGTGYAVLGENIIKEELEDGSLIVLERIADRVTTSSINLKIRSDEPNIQTFNELLQSAWPLATHH